MRIKALITLAVSANKEILPGQEYDLNEADAKDLIERGFAVSVKKETPPPTPPAGNKPNTTPKPAANGAKTVPPAERGEPKGQSDDPTADQGNQQPV